MFYGQLCAHGRLNGLSDDLQWMCPRQDSNSGGSDRSVVQRATNQTTEAPHVAIKAQSRAMYVGSQDANPNSVTL